MELAFPIPDHLPRAKPPGGDNLQATTILTAMSETTPLTSSASSTWIKQLDTAIAETKSTIHGRIHQDLGAFERQLETSKSIQRRLLNLSSNVDQLQAELDGSESSVLPNILKVLHYHSELAQSALDAETATVSLRHLQQCKHKYQQLSTLVKEGRLPEARSTTKELQALVNSSPSPLTKSRIWQDLNSLLRATKDSIQEQLLQAYSTCVSLSDSRLTIKHEYSQHLTLLSILDSITTESLLSTLAALRKEILARYITPTLEGKRRFELVSPLTLEVYNGHTKTPFHELSTLLNFLHDQLLSQIPESSRKSFASSFYVPLSEEIQTKLLPASIPSTAAQLPAFLGLIREAAGFERGAVQLGFFAGMEKRIETWGESAQSHYEKKRRSQLIDEVRTVILTDLASPVTMGVEVVKETTIPGTTAEPSPSKVEAGPVSIAEPAQEELVNWGFDDDENEQGSTNGHPPESSSKVDNNQKEKEEKEPEEDGWGFDDEDESMDQQQEPQPELKPERRGADPWGDEWDDTPMESPKPQSQPRSPIHPPNVSTPSLSSQSYQSAKSTVTVASVKVHETYLVSHAVTVIAQISTHAFDEGIALLNSRVFKDAGFASPHPTVLISTAPSSFDLFRALYPMFRTPEFSNSLSAKLQYSNDCKFLADTARGLRTQYEAKVLAKSQESESVATRFEEVADKLDLIGSSWFDENVEEETITLLKIYSGSGNFRELSYDAQFTEAQNSIKAIKDRIILLSKELRVPLTTTACYNTLGTIIDTVLDRIMQDVFSLRDISQVESERIASLCLLLHPLDTIFPELENGISTVASYVPLWLKFTYLSDILEGTMADISSWLEAGHLVDYEAEELCRLIIALFAESPLRQATISKIRATASS